MKDQKITHFKEKHLKQQAQKDFENLSTEKYTQNPIKAKFCAFQKTKKEIDIKDLF